MASALYILELEIASSLRRQRVFRDRLNPLDEYSDGEFIPRYRITHIYFYFDQQHVPIPYLQ